MTRAVSRVAAALLISGLAVGTAEAQTPESSWDFGVTAGVNIATFGGSDADGADNLTGFFGGVSMVFPINEMFSFQPEIIYSRKGAKGTVFDVNAEARIGYIDVPLLAKIFVGPGPAMRPALFFGPSVGFKISCDIELGGVSADCDDWEVPVKDLDVGVIGGAGLDFDRFGIFARYQYGLTKLDDSSDDAKIYNRVIQIGGRIRFW